MRIFDYSSVEKMRETIASWNVKPDEGDDGAHRRMKTLVDGGFEGGHMRTAYEEPFGKAGSSRESRSCRLPITSPRARAESPRLARRHARAWANAAIDQCWTPTPQQTATARSAASAGRSSTFFIGRPDHYPRVKALDW